MGTEGKNKKINTLHSSKGTDTYLSIGELEELQGDVLDFLVDRTHDGLNGALDRLHSGFQRTWVVLGEIVDGRVDRHRVHGSAFDELQILQCRHLIFLNLQHRIQINNTIRYMNRNDFSFSNIPRTKTKNGSDLSQA